MTEAPLDGADARSADFVQSLERGLAVIKAFDVDDRAMTLSDVARKTGLTRAAARRFLLTLADLGYVGTDGRLFSLRPKVLELGYAYLSGLSLPEVAHPYMEKLTARVHESTSISVLDDTDIVYVARVAAKKIMTVGISVGTRFPAHATSMGRVLMAYAPSDWLETYFASADLAPTTPLTVTDPDTLRALLEQVRLDGYAIVDQELEMGLRSVAVPLHDLRGRVVAALNVSTHSSRGTADETVRDLLPALQETATAIEGDLRVKT